MNRRWTLAALLALAPAPAAAQSALGPGSPQIRTAELRAATDTLDVLLVRSGAEIAAGVLVLRTEVGATLTRVERMTARGGTVVSVDSFSVDGRTLAPIVSRTRGEAGRELRFTEGRMTSSGAGEPVTTPLASPVFYGNSVDLVLGSLPLAEGFEARVRFHEEPATVRVAGAEEIATGDGGRCAAWRVEVAGGSHGGTYWMGRETRSLVRFDGSGGELRIVRRAGCASAPSSTRATE